MAAEKLNLGSSHMLQLEQRHVLLEFITMGLHFPLLLHLAQLMRLDWAFGLSCCSEVWQSEEFRSQLNLLLEQVLRANWAINDHMSRETESLHGYKLYQNQILAVKSPVLCKSR